jgi:hypothetical protein
MANVSIRLSSRIMLAVGGPTGSRSQHLGIKGPDKSGAVRIMLLHDVSSWLVNATLMLAPRDTLKLSATPCDDFVGISQPVGRTIYSIYVLN